MFSLSSAHNGCEKLYLGAGVKGHNLVYHLVHTLPCNFTTARRTVRNPNPCIQQAEIIIYFRYRSHCGTGIAVCGFLVYGDSRGQPFNFFYIRLFHLPQKLPCIGGERLHIASLSLCIYRIESKRAFAAAAHPRKDNQLISGDGEVNIFQIMRSRTLYYNLILHSVSFSWDIPFQRIAQVLTIIS